jgi:hypothetical protein
MPGIGSPLQRSWGCQYLAVTMAANAEIFSTQQPVLGHKMVHKGPTFSMCISPNIL